MSPALIVWDFDGVLNRNMVDGRFVWADNMEADLGIDPEMFSNFLFRSGRMRAVVRGEMDLRSLLDGWLGRDGRDLTADAFLAYWFEKDAMPDPDMTTLLRTLPQRHVIGTNNERHRAGYIARDMGYAKLVEEVFASGILGVSKPSREFFDHIQTWSGLPATDILIVDDSEPNIDAAGALGWQTFHYAPDRKASLRDALGLGADRP